MSKQNINKYKIAKKHGSKWIIIKSQKGQNLNLREVEDIQNGIMDYVLPMDVTTKNKSFALHYEITNFIPLRQYIQAFMNKQRYAEMMLQILGVYRQITEAFYNPQGLVLDMDKVMINPHMNKILFVFVPILYYNAGVSMKEFLTQLTYHTTFDSREDTSYVDASLQIIQKNMNFSAVELEEYLQSLIEDPFKNQDNFAKRVPVKGEYDPSIHMEREHNDFMRGDGFGVPAKTEDRAESMEDRYTESLSDVKNANTTILGADGLPYLKQVKTGQIYYLDKTENKIGKRQCDITISDNPAISKLHAVIYKQGTQLYIEDMASTNGTKLNTKRLIPENRELLTDEDSIEFADEKFIFYR